MSAVRLSLDHLTVTDATPSQLVTLAGATGCAGICLFLHSMPVLPRMAAYNLVDDAVERRATRAALAAEGVAVDMVYPFTMTGRTDIAAFEPALAIAAELGAPLANILCYDRDPSRRVEKLAQLAALAQVYGIGLAIEFYPPSQIRTLAEAVATVEAVGWGDVGVTLDLLHVMRGGGPQAIGPLLSHPTIRMAQISDGPATMPADRIEWEAGIQRMLPGEGVFDIAGFAAAVPAGVPLSVEVPQEGAAMAGRSMLERARDAVAATRRAIA